MTVYDDAIESTGWTGITQVTIGNGSNPLLNNLPCDVEIDRTVDDLTENITNITGTAAAQARITLRGSVGGVSVFDLSPFSTNVYSTRTLPQFGIGTSVVVTETVYPATGGGFQVYTVFTGTIDDIQFADDSVLIVALDPAGTMQGTVTLPTAGGSQTGTSDSRMSPLAVVDLAMRSGGKYLTPPLHTEATALATLISVPGIGDLLPEVGTFVTNDLRGDRSTAVANRVPPTAWVPFLPTVDVAFGTTVSMTEAIDSYGFGLSNRYIWEGWWLTTTGADAHLQIGADSLTTGVFIASDSSRRITVQQGASGPVAYTSTATPKPVGGGWMYLCISYSNGALDFYSPTTGTFTASGLSIDLAAILNGKTRIRFWGRTVAFDGWKASGGSSYPSAYTSNSSWTPNYSARLDSVTASITGVAAQSGSAWETVQQVAKAYGDVAWFDGAGVFRYETRATWKARRFAAAARTLTDQNAILSGMPGWGAKGVCRSVAVGVVTPQVTQSTAAAPAWQATEVYTVAARTTSTFQIDLDYQLFDLKAVTSGVASGASASFFYAVQATAVGDPAALPVGSVTVTLVPNSTGLAVTVKNGNTYAISLWEPVSFGPYLIVHGKSITFPAPKVLTRAAAATGQDLTIDENNPWRQDEAAARTWLDDIAQEVAYPQVVWSSLHGVVDPRRSIGDVLALNDSRHMDVTHPAQIVGTTFTLPAEGMHTLDYTVRTAYAPTALVIGVSPMTIGSSTMTIRA